MSSILDLSLRFAPACEKEPQVSLEPVTGLVHICAHAYSMRARHGVLKEVSIWIHDNPPECPICEESYPQFYVSGADRYCNLYRSDDPMYDDYEWVHEECARFEHSGGYAFEG